MIKICREKDLEQIPDPIAKDHLTGLLKIIIEANSDICPDRSLEQIGALYFVESADDLADYRSFGFETPLQENRFEWFTTFAQIYVDGCIILDNDRGMNIIGKKEFFEANGIEIIE